MNNDFYEFIVKAVALDAVIYSTKFPNQNNMYYKLEDKTTVKCLPGELPDFLDRKIFRDVFNIYDEDVSVSTVFLYMDHSFNGGTPLLFETMIFGGLHNNHQLRYSTWEDAEKGHEDCCQMVLDVVVNDRDDKINKILKNK